MRIREEGTHLKNEPHPTKCIINSTTDSDLPSCVTQTEMNTVLSTKQDALALLHGGTNIYLQNPVIGLKPIPAITNIVLTNDVEIGQLVEHSADVSSSYTHTEVRTVLGAINQSVYVPSVTGIAHLTSDGKRRTIDTASPLRTTISEAIDPHANVTERRITWMVQH